MWINPRRLCIRLRVVVPAMPWVVFMRYGGLIIAIAFAAIAAVIVLRMMSNEEKTNAPQTAAQVKTVDVYVAAKPIPIGTAITPDMVIAQPWPEHLVLDGFIRAQPGTSGDAAAAGASAVVGMVTRAPFQQQEPIIGTKLANPNDPNFLAAELPKGMRVVTIRTSETQGIAGFLFPGDHVDVILTHEVEKFSNDPQSIASGTPTLRRDKETITETLLTNAKVVAVDQHSTNAGATDADGKLIIPRSVSLMVSPSDAQRLRLAEKTGELTLVLRALADRDSADPLTLTQSGDVSQYKNSEIGGSAESVTVYHGVGSKDTTSVGNPLLLLNPAALGSATPTPRVSQ